MRVRNERGIDQWDGGARERSQLNGEHVVCNPSSIRVASQVTAEDAKDAWRACRWNGEVQSQQIGKRGAGESREPWNDPGRDAREKYGDHVRARFGVRGQVGENARIEVDEQALNLLSLHVHKELLVVFGWLRVPEILLAQRNHHLIEERAAKPGDLCPWPGLLDLTIVIDDCGLAPARRGVHANY